MATIKDNTIFDKTSFLEGSNSTFIKELYSKYVNNPNQVPESWKVFFDGLNEDHKIIQSEIQGPSWAPKKKNISKAVDEIKSLKIENIEKKTFTNGIPLTEAANEKNKEFSFKAIPCSLKIPPLASKRSLRSIPGPLGFAPTSNA